MVQYIITPWRNRRELLDVREAFYPSPEISKAISDKQRCEAVEQVSVWVQRGNCPHSVESTALLVSAILNEAIGPSIYAIRAAYSAAFSRFVTGLLDSYQEKRHKLSMYSIAKNIGLPATFVELRHQCTHEELPSLAKLRDAVQRSLSWIWDYYWKGLEESAIPTNINECRTVLGEYLQWRAYRSQDQELGQYFVERLRKWDKNQLLEVLMEFSDASITKTSILLQALRLSRAVLSTEEDSLVLGLFTDDLTVEKKTKSLEDIRMEIGKAGTILEGDEGGEDPLTEREEQQDDGVEDGDGDGDETGWQMWRGPWVPKPIGVI